MAKIVLGLASSHAPQLSTPADRWPAFIEKDRNDRRMSYDDLLARDLPGIEEQLEPEIMAMRHAACQQAMGTLREKVAEVKPDVIVVIGDDQHEQFQDSNMPMFSVFYGDKLKTVSRRPRDPDSPIAPSAPGSGPGWQSFGTNPVADREFPTQPDLASHIIETLVDEDVDVATSNALNEEVGVGHAFTFLWRHITPEGNIPVMPFSMNTFFKPNQPTPKRCYNVGEVLRGAIESWDSNARVAVMASGGLSHVIIDEEIDQMTLDALQGKDATALRTLPVDRLDLGTSEIRNWITLAATVEDKAMTLLDYQPCYRTPAGTGCAMGFAYWE